MRKKKKEKAPMGQSDADGFQEDVMHLAPYPVPRRLGRSPGVSPPRGERAIYQQSQTGVAR